MKLDDDTSRSSTTSIAKQRFEEERRRSRLYGSNARRRVKAGSVKRKKKKNKPPSCTETTPTCGIEGSPSPKSSTNKDLNHSESSHEESRQNELAKPRPWAQATKFVDPTKAECVQSLAWHVGYSNAATASGNPSAQAARYGPDGAFNLRIQCTDRVSRQAGKLEAILRSDDDTHNTVEQYNSISNVWNEPLRLGGEDHLFSTPKMWGNKSHCGGKKGGEDQLPRRLKKSLDHDTEMWKEMAASVRKERDKRRSNNTRIIQRKQLPRTGSHQSQRLFCLR